MIAHRTVPLCYEFLFDTCETLLQHNLFAYCWNNPINMHDPDGHSPLALAGGGYLGVAGTVGAANSWNPAGWVIIGVVAVVVVVGVGIEVHNSVKISSSNKSDPYARPGQKKQGRERKNKARQKKGLATSVKT